MVTTIQRRVSRLEEAAGGGCPDCGGPSGPSGAGPDDHSSYEVVWDDHAEEWCETCGRQTAIVIRWPEDLGK